jgi:hypothetical protein
MNRLPAILVVYRADSVILPAAQEIITDCFSGSKRPNKVRYRQALQKPQRSREDAPDGVPEPQLVNTPAAEEIVGGIIMGRRQQAHGSLDDLMDNGKGLPTSEEYMAKVCKEREAVANDPDEAGPRGTTGSRAERHGFRLTVPLRAQDRPGSPPSRPIHPVGRVPQ